MGHTPLNPGVDMYQQPGPSGSQATSRVMSCHPSGNKAVNHVLTMLTANYYGEVSEPPKKKAKKEKKPAGAVPAVN